MLNFIKRFFSKKKIYTHQVSEIHNFLLDRPNDWISFGNYYDYRFDNNEFYRLNVEMGLIIPIDTSINQEFEHYINENQVFLKEAVNLKNRTFIKDMRDLEIPIDLNINYYFPFVTGINPEELKNTNIRTLLNFIGYRGNITTGFLSFIGTGATFIGLKEDENIEEFVNGYINNMQVLSYDNTRRLFYSLGGDSKDEEPNIELDEETKLILDEIENNLTRLKQSGQFFLVAPRLEKIIGNMSRESDIALSDLIIDENFRIFLPQYGNTEITLSHLTKSIYILFLKHPEGILLTELSKYEDELFLIYQSISYQVSLDKMKNSIHELTTDDKAIFVHFSRIKSAFVKNFTNFYAEYYYIKGNRGDIKRIKLPVNKVNFKQQI